MTANELTAARSLMEKGDFAQARRLLIEALTNEATDDRRWSTGVLNALLRTWMAEDQLREAIDFFSSYIEQHPGDCDAYIERATALWYEGDLEAALADYCRALECKPDDLRALSGRGQVSVEQGQYEERFRDLDRAVRRWSDGPIREYANWQPEAVAYARSGLAAALAGLGEFEAAQAEFAASISLRPHNAWVYYNRAQAYERRGQRMQAIADYLKALEKRAPALNRSRRELAESRLRALLAAEE